MPDVELGSVIDADGDECHVSVDADGAVKLRWPLEFSVVFGRVARDQLRELLDRAAMPGQVNDGG